MLFREIGPYEYGRQILEKRKLYAILVKAGMIFLKGSLLDEKIS